MERDVENSCLNLDDLDEDNASAMPDLYGHSITYRIALGPQRGRKVFSLQTLPPHATQDRSTRLAKAAGFSLHAGVSARADQRDKLERSDGHPSNSTWRSRVTTAGRGRRLRMSAPEDAARTPPAEQRAARTRAARARAAATGILRLNPALQESSAIHPQHG